MTQTSFEPAHLPDSQKEALARSLLAEFGVTSVSVREPDGELIHRCVLPWHPETKPSASLNYKKLVYRCLPEETLVKTYDGEREIGSLAGTTATLLDGSGKWVQAPVKHYGQDRLYRVTMSRNGVRKEVYATADHRWYIRPKGRHRAQDLVPVTTMGLKPRHRIPSVWAATRTGRTTISPVGVMAGFVYGDGTSTRHGARANFYGSKDQALLPYFAGYKITRSGDKAAVLTGLPRSWKALPDLDEGPSYLWGWLAGYFAADGCVADDGHVTLACSSESALRFVIALCDRLGIATYTLNGRHRIGRSGSKQAAEESEIFSLSFRGSTLVPEFFLLPAHRERYERAQQQRRYERTHWWVVSVEETDRFEDVYCAEVPTTNSFVLADNILTGNCLGCDSRGGLLWLIGTVRGVSGPQAREWINNETGLGGADFDLAALLNYLDAVYEDRSYTPPPMPKFSPRVLEPWRLIHPWLTDPPPDGRAVPVDNIVSLQVGYAERYFMGPDEPTSERIVIPHFWKGDLVGWQSRRITDDGTPKYKSTADFPKDRTVYDYDPKRRVAVVVESPASVMRHRHHQPMEGTFGAAVTDPQVRLLARHERVVLWMDNDPAGWKAVLGRLDETTGEWVPGLADRLMPYSDVRVVDNPWAADPADMDDATVGALIHDAVPFAVWRKPEALLCWLCKQSHDGRCP